MFVCLESECCFQCSRLERKQNRTCSGHWHCLVVVSTFILHCCGCYLMTNKLYQNVGLLKIHLFSFETTVHLLSTIPFFWAIYLLLLLDFSMYSIAIDLGLSLLYSLIVVGWFLVSLFLSWHSFERYRVRISKREWTWREPVSEGHYGYTK